MRKAIWASAVAMSVAVGSAGPAHAAKTFTYVDNIAGDFGNTALPTRPPSATTFSDTFTFTTTKSLVANFIFSSVGGNAASSQTYLKFVTATINGTDIPITLTSLPNNSERREGNLFDFRLPAGVQTLFLSGDTGRSGSYSGSFSLVAVPEASTWAMMIAGFGMVGGAMRRKSFSARRLAAA